VSEYDLPEFEPRSSGGATKRLPGGLSMQALAAILLVIALLAILYLFFGPTPDAPPGLATETPVATQVSAEGAEGQLSGDVAPPKSTTDAGEATTAVPRPVSTTLAGVTTTVPGSIPTAGPASAASAATAPPASASLTSGSFATVGNTDGFGLRLRFGPGLDFITIRIVPDGESLKVMGDTEEAEGYTWHRLQDGLGNVGWGAREFVSTTTNPAVWSPPLASPTFESGAAAP